MNRPSVHVHGGPNEWSAVHVVNNCGHHMALAKARKLAAHLVAAAAIAEREEAVERELALDDRVWLYLSRLVWWHPEGMAKNLDTPEDDVLAALQRLAADAKVENDGPTPRGSWRALKKHPRARVDETIFVAT